MAFVVCGLIIVTLIVLAEFFRSHGQYDAETEKRWRETVERVERMGL